MDNIIKQLRDNKIGILPTDTIYGIVGKAMNFKVVERIYQIKDRTHSKPFIVLISDVNDLKLFGIKLTNNQEAFLNQFWPNPVSIILDCPFKEFEYLHRGTKGIAFRLPDHSIKEIIKQTGPLVAPSANPEGKKPAETITEAKNYFGDMVDFYLDGGKLVSSPSTLIKIKDEEVEVLRKGVFIPNLNK